MKHIQKITLCACFALLGLGACNDDELSYPRVGIGEGEGIYRRVEITADKACYAPGETVELTLDKKVLGTVMVRYRHLDHTLSEEPLTASSWTWTPPSDDFKGYMVDVYVVENGKETVMGSIGIDVSSDWTRFPRYGFLSKYDVMSQAEIDKVADYLCRLHINGVQYQDWHYKHHKPLAGTAGSPAAQWVDINNRNTSLQTIRSYIDTFHARNMKSMFYNLCYGALEDAAEDGVKEDWYIFKDKAHQKKDFHDLPNPFFWSDIYLTDPANPEWQAYMAKQNEDVYKVFDFDGYQIDQLGNRGTRYDYTGKRIDMPSAFRSFVEAMKKAHPDKTLAMNAVSSYGAREIASSPVSFLYNEVWGSEASFSDLADIIEANDAYSEGKLNTVFAAYINYNVAEQEGMFNTPSVLMADAVMFALGGAHIEMGEHMLGKEYFPNSNLSMSEELRKALVSYYDFSVAYQNLLRDGGTVNSVEVSCTDGKLQVSAWQPKTGKVITRCKEMDNRQIIHLLNMSQAVHVEWRDMDGKQPAPVLVENAALEIALSRQPSKVWVASPDFAEGVAQPLSFTQTGSGISLVLPSLKYWDMLVIEY